MEVKNKLRAVVSYEKLATEIQEQIKLEYPRGYSKHLIPFTDRAGNKIKALRFETEEKIYLIKMTIEQAKKIVTEDVDFDENGNLKTRVQAAYEDKYSDDPEDLEEIEEMEDIETLVGEEFEDDFVGETGENFGEEDDED